MTQNAPGAPWGKIKFVQSEQDLANRADTGFRLVLDFAGTEIVVPELDKPAFPASAGNKLALGLLALAEIDDRAAVELPLFGVIRLGNLREGAATLLAFFPGAIATDGVLGIGR